MISPAMRVTELKAGWPDLVDLQVAIESMGGPDIGFSTGRSDAAAVADPKDDNR